MEKNIYEIIQNWHELLKNGTITEVEFNTKKVELLNFEKKNNETLEKEKKNENVEYEKSTNYFHITFYILAGLVCATILFYNIYESWNKNNNESETFTNENIDYVPTYGKYIVQADNTNLVHFYEKPDIATQKKSYFSTKDTVYVSKIENGYGYVKFININGKNSIGWLPMDKLNFCERCEIQTSEDGESTYNYEEKNTRSEIAEFLNNNKDNQFCYFVNTDDEKNENGYSKYILKINIKNENEIVGQYQYIPNIETDSFGGELKGKINGDILEGILISEGEGMTNEEKFKLKISKEIAVIKFENEPEKVMNRDRNCE